MPVVGVIANPAAGRDIRRLVAEASPTSDMAKVGVIRRAVIGAAEGGATEVILSGDQRRLAERAIAGLPVEARCSILDQAVTDTGRDSAQAAERLRDAEVGAVVVLGGDGTHRDVATGWPDAPLVAVSTGTNNVFPRFVEATVAGEAAGRVAAGRVDIATVSTASKVLRVTLASGRRDLALVDVALVTGRFTASRAVWEPERLREVVACIAEPDAIGLSAIVAAVAPCRRDDDGAVHVVLGSSNGRLRRVPMAPGRYADLRVQTVRRLAVGDTAELVGPGVLAFDGERDAVLNDGERAHLELCRDGPRVIDVAAALAASMPTDDEE